MHRSSCDRPISPMRKHLAALFLGTGMLVGACSRNVPEPAPEFIGRWNARSTTAYRYDAAGNVLGQSTTPDASFYVVVTPDSLRYHASADGRAIGRHKYLRQGNEIQMGSIRCTITELTLHTLTLHFDERNRVPNTPYSVLADHYTR